MDLCLFYLLVVNLIGMILVIADKHRAKKSKWRIREKTLFFTALIGGAPFMYLTMLFIRHKTKHKKFMIGMPVIILLQLAATAGVILLHHTASCG